MLFSQFSRSKDQGYYKSWAKKTDFIYILGFIFYDVSRAKTDLHTKYLIVFGPFFEQYHLLNLINLKVYAKR